MRARKRCPKCRDLLKPGSGSWDGVPVNRLFCANEDCDHEETYPSAELLKQWAEQVKANRKWLREVRKKK